MKKDEQNNVTNMVGNNVKTISGTDDSKNTTDTIGVADTVNTVGGSNSNSSDNNVVAENTKNKKDKSKLSKILFFLAIPILAFASVKAVGLIVPAFSSLASLSDNLNKKVNNKNLEDIKINKEYTVINSDGKVKISWELTDIPDNADYAFKYDCSEGVLASLVEQNETETEIKCGEEYMLNGKNDIILKIKSDTYHYSDFNYHISLLDEDKSILKDKKDSITIINKSLSKNSTSSTSPDVILADSSKATTSTSTVAMRNNNDNDTIYNNIDNNKNKITDNNNQNESNDDEINKSETQITDTNETDNTNINRNNDEIDTDTSKTTSSVSKKNKSNKENYNQQQLTNRKNVKKTTDLAVTFINSGTILDKIFFPGQIKQKEKGAIQFEVRNIGNKVSGTWKYKVLLPNGKEYVSKVQQPLKPNERTLVSLGFYTYSNNSHTFIIRVDTNEDVNALNNQVIKSVILYK